MLAGTCHLYLLKHFLRRNLAFDTYHDHGCRAVPGGAACAEPNAALAEVRSRRRSRPKSQLRPRRRQAQEQTEAHELAETEAHEPAEKPAEAQEETEAHEP